MKSNRCLCQQKASSLSHHRSLACNLDLDKDCQDISSFARISWKASLVYPESFDQSHIFGPVQLNISTLVICGQIGEVLKPLVGLSLHIRIGHSIKNSTPVLQGKMTVSRLHCLIYSFCSTFFVIRWFLEEICSLFLRALAVS